MDTTDCSTLGEVILDILGLGIVERGRAPSVLHVHIYSSTYQVLDDIEMARTGSNMKRGTLIVITFVQIDTDMLETLQNLDMPA